jgi:hypothetical protein
LRPTARFWNRRATAAGSFDRAVGMEGARSGEGRGSRRCSTANCRHRQRFPAISNVFGLQHLRHRRHRCSKSASSATCQCQALRAPDQSAQVIANRKQQLALRPATAFNLAVSLDCGAQRALTILAFPEPATALLMRCEVKNQHARQLDLQQRGSQAMMRDR